MGGIRAIRSRSGKPLIRSYFVRASQDIDLYDVLVLMDDTLADRVIKATNTELQNTTPNGFLGIAMHSLKLDSSGQLVQSVPSTVETGAAVIYPVPSMSRVLHRASQALSGSGTDVGNYQIQVLVFTDDTEILIDVCNNKAATTVTQALQGLDYGIILDDGDDSFKMDVNVTSGNAAGLVVTEVDTTQANFNASADNNNAVWVNIKSTHQQYLTGLLY